MTIVLIYGYLLIGGKGKSKVKSDKELPAPPIEWDTINTPLKCMDVFAGCGGLTEGLHQTGIADTKWAVQYQHIK